MNDPEREIDPAPSECKKGKPYVNADIHDGAELIAKGPPCGPDHPEFVEGYAPEKYRCADCGREWEV